MKLSLDQDEAAGVLAMLLLSAATVYQAHGAALRAATAVAMVAAEAGLLVGRHGRREARMWGLVLAVLAGFAGLLLSPAGLAEAPLLVAASRLPRTVAVRWRDGVVVTFSVLFGVSIAYISRSWLGLLAGFGVWFLAQRTMQGDALQVERDRAVALLAQIEASRDAQAEAAAATERARIARDMHDVLAHSLAGLSLQLQAARAVAVREGVGEAVTTPLQRAADLAREGVSEARAAVSALARERGSSGLEAVEELVRRFPGSASYIATGPPPRLTSEAGHAVYRAVQESLTNSTRYAPGGAVRVLVESAGTRLVVTVTDDGPANADVPQPLGSTGAATGAGLEGMAERLWQVGGRLVAGPTGTGWSVRIEVPVGAS